MKNKKKFIIIAIILIVLIVIVLVQGIAIYNIKKDENKNLGKENNNQNSEIIDQIMKTENTNINKIEPITYTATEDSKRFKEEYEALNNTAIEEGGTKYNTVNISEENPIVYVDLEQLVNVINNEEKSYIFISSPTCAYCRAIVATLFEVTKNLGIEKLYYFDTKLAMNYEDETKKQELLDQLVEKNIITKNSQGNVSWQMPLVLKTQSGNILAKRIGISGVTLNEGQNQYSDLTEEQKQKVYEIYYSLLMNQNQ